MQSFLDRTSTEKCPLKNKYIFGIAWRFSTKIWYSFEVSGNLLVAFWWQFLTDGRFVSSKPCNFWVSTTELYCIVLKLGEFVHRKTKFEFWNRLTFLNKYLIFLRSFKQHFGEKSVKISDYLHLVYLGLCPAAGHLVTAYFFGSSTCVALHVTSSQSVFKFCLYHSMSLLCVFVVWLKYMALLLNSNSSGSLNVLARTKNEWIDERESYERLWVTLLV